MGSIFIVYQQHVNDINIDIKYTHKKHATNLLIQLVKEFNIDIIDGTGTYDEGEYFWERLGAKMSEYIYTKNRRENLF